MSGEAAAERSNPTRKDRLPSMVPSAGHDRVRRPPPRLQRVGTPHPPAAEALARTCGWLPTRPDSSCSA